MSERLTNVELDEAMDIAKSMHSLVAALAELRERRAADLERDKAEDAAFQRGRESVEHWKLYAQPTLTAEDVEALEFAAKCVESSFNRMKQSVAGHGMSDAVKHVDALAVLSKLTKAGR